MIRRYFLIASSLCQRQDTLFLFAGRELRDKVGPEGEAMMDDAVTKMRKNKREKEAWPPSPCALLRWRNMSHEAVKI